MQGKILTLNQNEDKNSTNGSEERTCKFIVLRRASEIRNTFLLAPIRELDDNKDNINPDYIVQIPSGQRIYLSQDPLMRLVYVDFNNAFCQDLKDAQIEELIRADLKIPKDSVTKIGAITNKLMLSSTAPAAYTQFRNHASNSYAGAFAQINYRGLLANTNVNSTRKSVSAELKQGEERRQEIQKIAERENLSCRRAKDVYEDTMTVEQAREAMKNDPVFNFPNISEVEDRIEDGQNDNIPKPAQEDIENKESAETQIPKDIGFTTSLTDLHERGLIIWQTYSNLSNHFPTLGDLVSAYQNAKATNRDFLSDIPFLTPQGRMYNNIKNDVEKIVNSFLDTRTLSEQRSLESLYEEGAISHYYTLSFLQDTAPDYGALRDRFVIASDGKRLDEQERRSKILEIDGVRIGGKVYFAIADDINRLFGQPQPSAP